MRSIEVFREARHGLLEQLSYQLGQFLRSSEFLPHGRIYCRPRQRACVMFGDVEEVCLIVTYNLPGDEKNAQPY